GAGTGGGAGGTSGSTGTGGGAGTMLGTSGGMASDPAGNVRLDIPAGALLGDTWFAFTPVTTFPGLPAGFTLVGGTAYRVDWTGAGFASAAPLRLRIRVATFAFAPLPDGTLAGPENKTAVQTCSGSGGTTTVYPDDAPSDGYGSSGLVVQCQPSGSGGSVTPGAGSATLASTTYTPPPAPVFPTIVGEPADVTVPANQTAAFSASASGTTPLTYQWRRNGVIMGGQTSAIYGLITQPSDSGAKFDVMVSNAAGRVVSRAALLTVAGCQDLYLDGNESDVDCGGSCPPCADGLTCKTGVDCASKVCDATKACAVPSCTDGAANGTESGIDCGSASTCGLCMLGYGCNSVADCDTAAYCVDAQVGKLCSAVASCGGVCSVVDTNGLACVAALDGTDPIHQCPLAGSACYSGACGCAAGLTLCSSCTDTKRDRDNCGQCGTTCGWSCASSACVVAAEVAAGGGGGTDGLGWQCVRQQTGGVACWGYGILGDGNPQANASKPVFVSGLTDAAEIVLGNAHACARRQSGAVVCWGANGSGQLGDGTTTTRLTPVAVTGLTDAVELTASSNDTCARRANGTVVCWGDNAFGQTGDGSKTARSTPTPVSGLTDATQISTGGFSACARKQSGQVVCWGMNSFGRLGDGTTTEHLTPGPTVLGLTDAVEVTTSDSHACARRSGGGVMCWGQNPDGEVGNGTTGTQQLTPVAVSNVTDAVQISAGHGFTCARRTTGEVVCWGWNSHCNLGDGSAMTKTTPVAVMNLADAVQISADGSNAAVCALRASGPVDCWGGRGIGAACTPSPAPAP
ncbi:MAG TPA: hypothetical protein VN903_01135, partial [Polyangia bacterium]|nr:hypothetical protein [Polyangia bacterium]